MYVCRQAAPEWRSTTTSEERAQVRTNIREAYLRNTTSYDDALNLLMALQEECLYVLSPSRLDYIKNVVQVKACVVCGFFDDDNGLLMFLYICDLVHVGACVLFHVHTV